MIVAATALGVVVHRRRTRDEAPEYQSALTFVGAAYGLLLGLLVVFAVGHYTDVRHEAQAEASTLVALQDTVRVYPPETSDRVRADCFGAPFTTPEAALAEDVAAIPDDELEPAQLLWGSVDSPWAHFVEEARFAANIERFLQDAPDKVLGTHLPPIQGDLDRHVKTLTKLPSSTPYVTADQAALEAFMATMAPQ